MSLLRVIISLSSLLVYGAAFGQSAPMDSIPFKLHSDNRIYTYCKVNNSDTLIFLVDTGASDMVINSERISKVELNFDGQLDNIGTTGIGSVKASKSNLVTFGRQVIREVKFISIPYPNERWDGVLGLSVLNQFVVKIDYDKMLIYLFDKYKYYPQEKDINKIKMRYLHQVPVVDVEIKTIDGKERKLTMEIDTGSDRILDVSTSYVNNNKLLGVYTSAFAKSTVTSSDGKEGVIYNVYFPVVKLARLEFYKVPGGVAQIQHGIMNTNGFDGIIGNWFLKRFNLTFDFKNDYIYLEPNNHLHTAYYRFLTDTN